MRGRYGKYTVQDVLGFVRVYATGSSTAMLSAFNYSQHGVPDTTITGEWRDETEIQYHRARYLSPGLGTWLSLDPFEGTAGRSMSLNGYSYVEGDVVNAVDPSGLRPRCQVIPPTPTPQPTCSGAELDECDIRYLAHASASEAFGTNSNTVIAAIMLAQINAYKAGGFAPLRVAEMFLWRLQLKVIE